MNRRLQSTLLTALAVASVATAQDFTVTLIAPESVTQGINDAGYVTGYSYSTFQAFFYKDGTITHLGSGLFSSIAQAANASGEVVGAFTAAGGSGDRAFVYRNGTMTDINYGSGSGAFGINDAGTVVGFNEPPGKTTTPFIYANGAFTELDVSHGSAQAINNSGQVVGYALLPGMQAYRAFLYQDGLITDLGVPVNGSFHDSFAWDISENGKFIVGWADPTQFVPNIAFLDTSGKMIALGTPGGPDSFAYGVNDSGEVVGTVANNYDPGSGELLGGAFLYRDGQMIDLNSLISPDLGINLLTATGINDEGWIAATALVPGLAGEAAVLLKPNVPEPAARGLFGLGIALLGMANFRRRWRRHQHCECGTP